MNIGLIDVDGRDCKRFVAISRVELYMLTPSLTETLSILIIIFPTGRNTLPNGATSE